ncbi:hypothetical protein QBC38DRAFT_450753 [Podospora fimiseda]|uniref:Secreted protein n=1 Tax=Podospora fimiseda TaxID=252190 RepID=A0AAN7BYB2_9PEZI|nr:hypothetical protein QBC38DRAFT_450753 [Podospora fimiseda]
MKSTNILNTLAVLLAGANALSTPLADRSEVAGVPEGYGIVDIEWEVETTPGGPNITLTGTAEQVHAQLVKINPNWDEEFAPIIDKRSAEFDNSLKARALDKRDWIKCGAGHSAARQGAIETGVAYLRTLSGSASRGPGPRNCGRVSCSYDSAIWYCNDNTGHSKSMQWFHIANAAQVLLDACSWESWYFWYVRGERWHNDGWFAIVMGDSC